MRRAALALVALLGLVTSAGCHDDPAVASCADPLGGLWRSSDGERFHIVDDGAAIEIFALGAEVASDSSASYLRLEREGARLEGFSQRFRQGGRGVCRVRTPATVARCSAGALELDVGVAGDIDFSTCAAGPALGEKRLTLGRTAALP